MQFFKEEKALLRGTYDLQRKLLTEVENQYKKIVLLDLVSKRGKIGKEEEVRRILCFQRIREQILFCLGLSKLHFHLLFIFYFLAKKKGRQIGVLYFKGYIVHHRA